MYLPHAAKPWLPVQPSERIPLAPAYVRRTPRQQIHAAAGVRAAGLVEGQHNAIFPPRTPDMSQKEMAKRIEVWVGHPFERQLSDEALTRAYDLFAGMSDERLEQMHQDVDAALREMINPPVNVVCPTGQHADAAGACTCDAPNEKVNGTCVPPCGSGEQRIGPDGMCVPGERQLERPPSPPTPSPPPGVIGTTPPAPTTDDSLEQVKVNAHRSGMVKGAVAGAGVVGLAWLLYVWLK